MEAEVAPAPEGVRRRGPDPSRYACWYIAATWKDPEPTENDGLAVVVVGFGSVAAACGFLWWAANRPLARRTRLSRPHYWLLSGLGTLLPTAELISLGA
ncbi:hypothetical protein [Streptomyces formicae]